MSFGFYKLGSSNADFAGARTEKASAMGDLMARLYGGFHVGGVAPSGLESNDIVVDLAPPPKVEQTLVSSARQQGFTGNTCLHCSGSRMKRAGHCEVCEDCGETTGCS
jgi:ribonucleoside-diphosphate reductase alpha chain